MSNLMIPMKIKTKMEFSIKHIFLSLQLTKLVDFTTVRALQQQIRMVKEI
jgi:hypothetical protein